MPQPLIELSEQHDTPILHIAVANGFPPHTYMPMLRPLMEMYRIVSFPPRALWGDQTPPQKYQDWWTIADDILAALDAHEMQNVTAIGHSFGAIASMLAVIKEPQRFNRLVLLDPTILLPNVVDMTRQAWEQDVVEQIPLVRGAMRRRRVFDSVDDAFERFRGKQLFADWSDEVLRLYVEHGTQPQSDSDGVELSWSAEWEAYYFSTVHQSIWDDVPRLNALIPTLILRGEASDAFVMPAVDRTKTLIPSADFRQIDGHGHLFPQSAPHTTGAIIATWLSQNI